MTSNDKYFCFISGLPDDDETREIARREREKAEKQFAACKFVQKIESDFPKQFKNGFAVKRFLKDHGFRREVEVRMKENLHLIHFAVTLVYSSTEPHGDGDIRKEAMIGNHLLAGTNAVFGLWSYSLKERKDTHECLKCYRKVETRKNAKGPYFCSEQCRKECTCSVCKTIPYSAEGLRKRYDGRLSYRGTCSPECMKRIDVIRKNKRFENRVRNRVDRDLSVLAHTLQRREATNAGNT